MPEKINSGDLRFRVVLREPTSSLNDEGGKETSFANKPPAYAAIRRFNQFRATGADATALVGALDFYLRWSEDRSLINKDWLLDYDGKTYVIHEVENINERNKFIRITGKVRTNG